LNRTRRQRVGSGYWRGGDQSGRPTEGDAG
jgi:hypothetical protein